ncbi:MAG TPA: ornithine cyclodeaminase family protein [Gemmatimonadaceae bacterium]|nr:ornithine cyclodeaminase family protein [Gemmatimonadaceae bacterium]
MLILNRREVTQLLSMSTCITLMEQALASLSRGEVMLPLRPVISIPNSPNIFAVMPTYSADLGASAAKLITVYPENHGTALDSHQGMVALFDGTNGSPLAIMDAASITAIRTAAVSAVATKLLARPESRTLAILGAGVQGRSHVDAMLAVRKVERVILWSRTSAHARSLMDDVSAAHDTRFEVAASVEAAVCDADVVCTVTASREPVLEGTWLRPGTHINAVGASIPTARELDTAAVAGARVFVDRRESALNEAGDILIPMKQGVFGPDHIVAEVGEVLIGAHPGRETNDEITLFKSLGLAVEDLACAHYLHGVASEGGVGTRVSI